MPRGGVSLFPVFGNLACPTFGNRPIVFQGLFSGLSHPIAVPPDSPLLTHKRTSTLVVGMSALGHEQKMFRVIDVSMAKQTRGEPGD